MRPTNLGEFIGQEKVKAIITMEIEAFRKRQAQCLAGQLSPQRVPIQHILLEGASGLGKTALATVIANETGTKVHITGPNGIGTPESTFDLMTKLTKTWYTKTMEYKPGEIPKPDVIFVDEVHLLNGRVQDMLLTAMEQWYVGWYKKDIFGIKKAQAFGLPEFTLIGATTSPLLLTEGFRSRCITLHLDPYREEDLVRIADQYLKHQGLPFEPGVPIEIARRSRQASRFAVQFCDRIVNLATARGSSVTVDTALKFFDMAEVDGKGFTKLDRMVLQSLAEIDHPLGIESLASLVRESREIVEGISEPFLIRNGFVVKTPRGRAITDEGREYVSSWGEPQ